MSLIKREDEIKHFKAKADHYRKRLARIEAQGDAIGYDPTEQINGFKDEIAIYESFVKELEDIPSAEKRGEWIYPTDIIGFGRCNNCKALWDKSLIDNIYFKYCPRCGARMVKGADDEHDK